VQFDCVAVGCVVGHESEGAVVYACMHAWLLGCAHRLYDGWHCLDGPRDRRENGKGLGGCLLVKFEIYLPVKTLPTSSGQTVRLLVATTVLKYKEPGPPVKFYDITLSKAAFWE
jgi:hypothetical protein